MKRIWDVDELAEYWSLKFEETQLLKTKPARNHLAFVALLKYYQNTGRFPLATNDISESTVFIRMERILRMPLNLLSKEVEKLSFIRSLHLPIETFASFNAKVLQRYRRRVNSESAWEVKQHPDTIRYGLYAIFLYWRQREIIDALRTRRREVPASQLSSGNDDERDFDDLFNERGFWATGHKPHRWTEPEDSLEQQQFWRIFELCLDHLPARTAQIFSMLELLGLDTEEICKELAITTSNCWVILHRARMGLRLCLEEEWFN